jgi:hypothetical protein
LALALSAVNHEILRSYFAPVRDFFIFTSLSVIESAQSGALNGRDVDKRILAAPCERAATIGVLYFAGSANDTKADCHTGGGEKQDFS